LFDISKPFDKVWHKGLLSELHHAGIRGNLLTGFLVTSLIDSSVLFYLEVLQILPIKRLESYRDLF
jgi:hypothetical protein